MSRFENYLIEAKKVDQLTQYWKDYSEAYTLEDYYTNDGERKGVDPAPYAKTQKKIFDKVAKEYGTQVAKDMEAHADKLADYWYMGRGSAKSGASLRKKNKIDWDGDL